MKIDTVYIVMETDLEGHVTLHQMYLDSSDAYNRVMELIKDGRFQEETDEEDRTIWVSSDSYIQIRPCPTDDLNNPL